ncbi:MAG: 5-(carboxyamino)imidazole ribonucleotide mutase [Gemmatimonadota bacterium]|jgi:phosphoribosylaminoimidazole carboxylase PurE protein|nr:5-(carboxyamino)imidazole ribonucleotide mutase [Gemmatimonadota bacterium]MDP6460398.1 5-(carboxyamino)imidazole ribonucleotide mutase [Gemmatimonadota bacterium]MDP6528368.1 5-(carboxyamino)imidazole ribonucleotide mutase [Gemmatimonadota bacterium]MDP6802824.1 5-(carboxyamino)imidazole ribonucleotide mutase [Gemmatimonadota bacterium]MDP7031037.1 5-(carboxyamino)imidazole ribonucleotide mutase [Gemmatimonadota bacterium]
MADPRVLVMIGSESDREQMQGCVDYLDRFEIPYEFVVSSAHRTPEKTRQYAQSASERGVRIIICGAGMSAHLPGAVAAETTLPVIGVPLPGSALSGMDSLQSIVQMPAGVPVATMAIGTAGARNAAIFAAQVIALTDEDTRERLTEFKTELASR